MMDLLYNPQTWVILTVLLFIALIAIQCFFCLRISLWPGLLMPAFFLCIWAYFQFNWTFLPIEDIIGASDKSNKVFTTISSMGIVFSLLLYGIIRAYLHMKRRAMAQRRKARMAEKQRILAERQANGLDTPGSNANPRTAATAAQKGTASPKNHAEQNPASPKASPTKLDMLKQQLAKLEKEKYTPHPDAPNKEDTRELNLP